MDAASGRLLMKAARPNGGSGRTRIGWHCALIPSWPPHPRRVSLRPPFTVQNKHESLSYWFPDSPSSQIARGREASESIELHLERCLKKCLTSFQSVDGSPSGLTTFAVQVSCGQRREAESIRGCDQTRSVSKQWARAVLCGKSSREANGWQH
jgi:hypothetical protein